tara:strand:+ start:408 stop:638 length:231 start_codon:yes stop_codon:yes gene_type:complete
MPQYEGPYAAFTMISSVSEKQPEDDTCLTCVCQARECHCPEPCAHCDCGDCHCKKMYTRTTGFGTSGWGEPTVEME